jgi:glutamate-ammonia-ligase adenylyltransferase
MRDRIAQAKGDGGIWDFKIGRGKMQEIELLSQAGALLCTGAPPANVALSLKSAAECGWLDPDTSQHLAETYKKLWALQCGAKLLSGEQIDPEQIAESSAQFLCRLAGASDFQELEATLRVAVETAAQMIDQSLQAAEG